LTHKVITTLCLYHNDTGSIYPAFRLVSIIRLCAEVKKDIFTHYWNIAFDLKKGDIIGDEEGLKTLDRFADNVSGLLEKLGSSSERFIIERHRIC